MKENDNKNDDDKTNTNSNELENKDKQIQSKKTAPKEIGKQNRITINNPIRNLHKTKIRTETSHPFERKTKRVKL